MCADVLRVDQGTAARRSSRARSGGSRAAGTGGAAAAGPGGGSSMGRARGGAVAAALSSTPVSAASARYAEQIERAEREWAERLAAQRTAALAEANRIRVTRAQWKRDVKARRVSLRDLVVDPPEWAATMRLLVALRATPTFGRVKAVKLLQVCRVSPSATLGGLTDRQRVEVASMLRR